MQTLADREAILHALTTPLPDAIRPILQRIASDSEIADYTFIAIIDADDSEQVIIKHLGWSPLVHPIDETRHDHSDFEPYWAHLDRHQGWLELCHIVGNDGFAYVLLIEDAGDSELVTMCRRHAV